MKAVLARSLVTLQDVEQQGGLARTGLGNQSRKPNLALNPEDQRGHGFAMLKAGIKKARIGRHPEGMFPQAVKLQHLRNHRSYPDALDIYAVCFDADTTSLSRSLASSSTANDCMMLSIETTILNRRVCFTMTPSRPRKGPTLMRTLLPRVSKGCGSDFRVSRAARSASTSPYRQRSQPSLRAHDVQHTRHFQNFGAVFGCDTNKQIAGK